MAVTDNFNRADGALGANWTTNASFFFALTIVSNACKGGTGSQHNVSYYSAGGTIAADQYAQVKVTTTGGFIGPVLRYDGAGTFYTCYYNAGTATIYKWISGGPTQIGTGSTITPAIGDVIYFEAVGSALTFKVNGTTVCTATDSSITAAGYTGIDIYDTVGAVDDFEGGAVSANVTVNLTGVAASPAVGTGTFKIDNIVSLTGVAATAAIGTGTINNVGTFNPASIGGLTVWLKADSLLVSNGGPVSPWTDMSGGGNDGVIVGTPAPTVRANALKGLPVVRFTTSEGRVRGVNGIGSSGLPAPAYNYTVIYVTRTVGPTVGRVFSALYPETNFLVGFHSSGMDTAYDGSAFLITATAYGTLPTLWKLYSMTGSHDGVTAADAFYKDGALLAGSGGGTGLQFHYNLSGYDATATLETCDCEVAELLIYNHALSTADLQAVWKYLGDKWFNVLLIGVAANPQVGAGTVAIEVVAPPAGELVAGGIRRGWVEDETEYLQGVAATPEVGKITVIARGTLEDLERMFPFPRPPEAPKRIKSLIPPKPPIVPVFMYMAGVNTMPRVGTGKVNAFYEDIDEETIAMIDLL